MLRNSISLKNLSIATGNFWTYCGLSLAGLCLFTEVRNRIFQKNTAWKVFVFGVFLVHIFPEYLSIFSLNAGKCRPEKLRIRTFFRHWKCSEIFIEYFTHSKNKMAYCVSTQKFLPHFSALRYSKTKNCGA